MFSRASVILFTGAGGVWQTPPADTRPPRMATAADGTHPTGMHSCYRPQQSCGKGNIFTPVCHSVHGGGLPGRTPLPERTPPPLPGRTPPPGPDTPPPREADCSIRSTSGRYASY